MLFPVKVFNDKGKLQYEISARKVLEKHNKIFRRTMSWTKDRIQNYYPKNHVFHCTDCGIALIGATIESSKLCTQCSL